ncbi:MAG: LysR family transcriptional regulator [Gammaproteobacteria bacterium]|nr:LysR family transcriptional regulator [Gammaproteobacteria bacterium]MBU1443748.1 LysR family transcriptional regulator [Gammaproteobacteria bacterium]
MELRHLRYFLAVAEARHFGRAAARLNIAQPPLSVQIRDLENELGTALFQRTARGVTLSDAGAAFLPHAEAVLAASRQAVSVARDAAAGRGGRLVIGFIPTLAYTLLPHLLPSYREAYPGVAISLREVLVTDKEDALLSGSIDVGIYRPPARHPEIQTATIGEERMILAVPTGHRLARRKQVAAAEIAGEPLLMYPPSRGDQGLYGTVATWLRTQDIQPESAEIAGTIHTALGMVLSGAGIAIVPESSACLRIAGIAFRPFAEPQARVPLAVCWRHGDPNGLCASFIRHVQAAPHPWSGAARPDTGKPAR